MVIGILKEIKESEYRVSLLPVGAELLTQDGHTVLVEEGAGLGSGIYDSQYAQAGGKIVNDARDIFKHADLIVKVKEPLPEEFPMLHEKQVIFTYFHFAANLELAQELMQRKVICIAYETIQTDDGELPLLTPMSEIAGKMSVQEGAKYLEKPMMGRGILLGGVPGVAPAEVVILGGGTVGANAAKVAAGLGAKVTILDINLRRLRYLDDIMPPNVVTLMSDLYNIRDKVHDADLLIGAVLIPGGRTPNIITEEMVKTMKEGAVIVDVAIDQGGCVETSQPTTHQNPTFIKHGVVHYCVTNMPGAVGRTSTYALTNATLPYVLKLANKGWRQAVKDDSALAQGLNIANGKICFKAIAEALNLDYVPLKDIF
ncbi:alanine dehydrogenase [Candidatus Poribacteria bacterium]|nr:alanine dehydrogenase [Candidatus Poribacteria bacterium]